MNIRYVQIPINKTGSEYDTVIYVPSTRQRLVYKNDIPLLRGCDIPLLSKLELIGGGQPLRYGSEVMSTYSYGDLL